MTIDRILNDAFISLRCSLFQYVGENSPWMASIDEQATQAKLQELIEAQRRQIEKLAELLSEEINFLDKGTYPTDYTDLQYLSLSYLMKKIIADQLSVSKDLEGAISACGPDSKIGALLTEIRSGIARTIEELTALESASSSAN